MDLACGRWLGFHFYSSGVLGPVARATVRAAHISGRCKKYFDGSGVYTGWWIVSVYAVTQQVSIVGRALCQRPAPLDAAGSSAITAQLVAAAEIN